MSVQNSTEKPAPALLAVAAELLVKSIQPVVSILFICSIAYDYSFLWRLGLSFDQVPTSLTEHFRSAIIWSPLLLPGYMVAFLLPFITVHLWLWVFSIVPLSERTKAQISTSSDDQSSKKTWRRISFVFRLSVLISVIVAIDAGSRWLVEKYDKLEFDKIVMTIGIGWVIIAMIVLTFVTPLRFAKQNSFAAMNLWIGIAYLPPILAAASLYGFYKGEYLLTQDDESWIMILRDNKSYLTCQISGFRRFDQVTVVVDATVGVLGTGQRSPRSVRVIASNTIERVVKSESAPLEFLPSEPDRALGSCKSSP